MHRCVSHNHYYENLNGKETCIDDEIPFEIPESWGWCRLGSMCTKIGSGSTPKGGSSVYVESGIMFIRSQNVYNDGLRLSNVAFITPDVNETKKGTIVIAGDILLNITGASIGRCALVPDAFDVANVNQHVMILRLVELSMNTYVHFVVCSTYIFSQIMKMQVGATKEGLSVENASSFLIPIPPLNQQLAIVKLLKSAMVLSNKHEDLHRYIKSMCYELRNSIICNAIQGKLTSRNPNDKPVIIDCKNPIIRRDNSYYEVIGSNEVCIDEDIPFEIPENWKWCRLETITNYGQNTSVKSGEIPEGSKIIDLEDIEKNTGRLLKHSLVSSSKESTRHKFSSGDVLYSKLRPYLNKVLIPDFDGYCSSEIMVLETNPQVSNEYLQQSLMSPYFIDYAMSKSYGCKMPRLGTNDGKNALIPIPPLPEQQRIVSKVKELQSLLDALE